MRYAAQLVLVWIAGSVTMGTVALSLVAGEPSGGFRRLPELSAVMLLAVLALFVGLLAGLLVTIGRSGNASWLAGTLRGRLLWVLLVATVGFVGWGYAATVTFVAEFTPGAQITLAYVGGGAPFALVAAMLQRPWLTNAIAGGTAFVLIGIGPMLAGTGVYVMVLEYLHLLERVLTERRVFFPELG